MYSNWKNLSFWLVKTLITHYSLLPTLACLLEQAAELHRGVSFTRVILEAPVKIDKVNVASTFPLICFMTQLWKLLLVWNLMNDDWTKKCRECNDWNLVEGNIKLDELDIKKFQKLVLCIYKMKNISFHSESLEDF